MTDPSMTVDALIDALPDLLVVVRRDGVVLQCGGGHGVPELRPLRDVTGQRLEGVWSHPVAGLLRQLTRRAITSRTTTEARFEDGGCAYEARASAHGPERALCVVRAAPAAAQDDAPDATEGPPRPHLARRGFLRRSTGPVPRARRLPRPRAVRV